MATRKLLSTRHASCESLYPTSGHDWCGVGSENAPRRRLLPKNPRLDDNGAVSANNPRPIRIAVVEDQALFREMLVATLSQRPEVDVVASAAGASEARKLLRPGSVDVALLDVDLQDGNGLALGIQLRRADPDIGIILLSSHDVMELLLDLPADVRRGWGYLSKTSSLSTDSLIGAIQATASGATVIDPELLRTATPREGSAIGGLSSRQYEVLQLVAQGYSNAVVAERLALSERSIEDHLGNIYAALSIPDGNNARVTAVLRLIEETSRGQH